MPLARRLAFLGLAVLVVAAGIGPLGPLATGVAGQNCFAVGTCTLAGSPLEKACEAACPNPDPNGGGPCSCVSVCMARLDAWDTWCVSQCQICENHCQATSDQCWKDCGSISPSQQCLQACITADKQCSAQCFQYAPSGPLPPAIIPGCLHLEFEPHGSSANATQTSAVSSSAAASACRDACQTDAAAFDECKAIKFSKRAACFARLATMTSECESACNRSAAQLV